MMTRGAFGTCRLTSRCPTARGQLSPGRTVEPPSDDVLEPRFPTHAGSQGDPPLRPVFSTDTQDGPSPESPPVACSGPPHNSQSPASRPAGVCR